ncbi:hypothetical protein PInf_008488 [Phytophthora infestans]|nr:hypothetical protein PInf_008488 [Phytophthora infestans]
MDPSELVKEVDRVRAQSYLLDAAVNAFTRLNSIRSYIAVPDSVPSNADRQRTQYSELDDISMVTQSKTLSSVFLSCSQLLYLTGTLFWRRTIV